MAKLKNLFNEGKNITLEDDDGQKVEIRVQQLRHQESIELGEQMDTFKAEVRKRVDHEDTRKTISAQYDGLSAQDLIGHIIAMEKPSARSVVDLAPAPDEETKPDTVSQADWQKQREEKILSRWETERREGLTHSNAEILLKMLVERRVNLLVGIQVQNQFMREAFVRIVVDPESRKRLLTDSVQEAANDEELTYIGDLTPRTWNGLVDAWNQFTDGQHEKTLRRIAESKDFLSSGKPPSASDVSPGATTESSSSSLPQLSISTRKEDS